MTERALSAIDTVVALSSHTLTAIAVVTTLVALVGGFAIYLGAREMARKVATRRMDSYIRSNEGAAFQRQAVADEVRTQIEQKIVVVVQPDRARSNQSTFPPAPTQTGD